MPKAILEFNLPEERDEHRVAVNGGTYLSVIHEYRESIRRLQKDDNATAGNLLSAWRDATEGLNWEDLF